jgi:hypothetical protein
LNGRLRAHELEESLKELVIKRGLSRKSSSPKISENPIKY